MASDGQGQKVRWIEGFFNTHGRARMPITLFHGENTGSNPVGDANKIKGLVWWPRDWSNICPICKHGQSWAADACRVGAALGESLTAAGRRKRRRAGSAWQGTPTRDFRRSRPRSNWLRLCWPGACRRGRCCATAEVRQRGRRRLCSHGRPQTGPSSHEGHPHQPCAQQTQAGRLRYGRHVGGCGNCVTGDDLHVV